MFYMATLIHENFLTFRFLAQMKKCYITSCNLITIDLFSVVHDFNLRSNSERSDCVKV
jgi:general stress protein CsbA